MPSKAKKTNTPVKPPLAAEYTSQFRKDWQNLQRSGKCNVARLKPLMALLIVNNGPIDPIYREHTLIADWTGFLECHMGGDVLLIYDRSESRIVFTRAGSHATLFEN